MGARLVDTPSPGYYHIRLCRGGPWVPVRIWLEGGERDEAGELLSDEVFRAKIGDHEMTWDELVQRWPWLRKIKRSEYDYLMAAGRYAAAHEPDAPEANPRRAIDLTETKSLF